MEQIKETALRQQDSPQKTSKNIVPAGMAHVKNPLRRLRLMTGLPVSSLVKEVRMNFPRYDKYLHSKCERTEEYGITLCKEALDGLISAYAPEMDRKAPRAENRVRPCRVVCRLTEADYGLLQQLIQARGFGTVQEYMHQLLIRQIRRWEKSHEKP